MLSVFKMFKTEFSGDLGVRLGLGTFTAEGTGSILGWGTKIPQAMWCGKKKKKNFTPF